MNETHTIVVTGIVKHKDKFLVVKRSNNSEIHPNKWCFPGGIVNPKEELIEALAREIAEETNITIINKKTFISDYCYKRPNNTQTIGLCFLVETNNNEVILNKELSDSKWITKEEFQDLDHVEDLDKEVEKAFP